MDNEAQSLKARLDRVERLYRVSQAIHSTLEPGVALERILEQALDLTGASSGSVVLVNPTTGLLEIQASKGLSPRGARRQLKLGEGITGWVAQTGQPARVADVRTDARYVEVRRRVRSELAVPLEVQGGVRGVLNVDADRPNAFDAADQELIEELAAQAAVAIHHTWLYEQLRRKAGLFESLVSVGQTINSALDLDDVLQRITREACHLMRAKMSSLLLADAAGEWLDLRASWGAGEAYRRKPRLAVAESLVGVVLRRRKPLQVENVQASSRYQNLDVARREGLVALLSVPLVYGGLAIGVLNVYTGQPHFFSNEEIRILLALADLSALAIEKARLYERVVDVEEQLRRSEKLSVLGLLAAEVAHEIRNPLTVIKMLLHSLDLRFPAGDPRARDAEVMSQKMEQLNQIVDRVLGFARENEPRFASLNLRGLVEELILLTRHRFQQQAIRVATRWPGNLPPVMGDAAQLGQAFLNLMLNAADAMPAGGRLTISARALPSGKGSAAAVQIEFRDTGIGMSADQQRRAFTPFLGTTKEQGTGLGLAVVGRILEAHHGQIRIRSRPGVGTTFRIVLPQEAEETARPGP